MSMSDPASPFELTASFEAGTVEGGVRLGRLEAQYEELFSEVIEDGVITVEERARLEQAADALGLDRARLLQVEHALTAAYEARRRVRVREIGATADAPVPPDAAITDEPTEDQAAPSPREAAAEMRAHALSRRLRALEARVAELERENDELRAQASVEV